MAEIDYTAADVLDSSASLLNDTAKTNYTYAAQIPYLRIAMNELQEYFQLHNIPVTQLTSALINIPAGITQIIYDGVGIPSLPSDMNEPQQLWERAEGIDPYIPMHKRDYLPHYSGTPTNQFGIYVWENQTIKFLVSNRDNDIKIDYIRQMFGTIINEFATINIKNANTFLEYRTAALCAEFIERNTTSSDSLNAYASLGLDRATGISIKGKQSIMTRRRPFRSNYKSRR